MSLNDINIKASVYWYEKHNTRSGIVQYGIKRCYIANDIL